MLSRHLGLQDLGGELIQVRSRVADDLNVGGAHVGA
jgi:hypothetical protein